MKFSVIIPTYNRAAQIKTAINSVLNQTYKDFELIIVDDGSTDNTEEVIKNIANSKIKYYKIKNSERSFARNYGASLSAGDYVNFFDSDDILYENHLHEAINLIEEKNNPEAIHLNYHIKNSEGEITAHGIDNPKNLGLELVKYGNKLSCNGVFLRKDICSSFPFNEQLYQSEDYELWLRLVSEHSIYTSNKITSCIINHLKRSVFTIKKKELESQFQIQLDSLMQNQKFVAKYKNYFNYLIANNYSYISLHILLGDAHKRDAIKYLVKGIFLNPRIIFSRRFLAIIKYLILK